MVVENGGFTVFKEDIGAGITSFELLADFVFQIDVGIALPIAVVEAQNVLDGAVRTHQPSFFGIDSSTSHQ
jgi:hypothetical protein